MVVLVLIFWQWNIHIVFHSGCTNLQSKQCTTIPFYPHLCQHIILSLEEIRGDISFWFWFAFMWWLIMLSNFSCTCWPSVYPLWKKKCLFRSSANFLVRFFMALLLNFMSYLYTLDINPLSMRYANIFSHWSVAFFFVVGSLLLSHLSLIYSTCLFLLLLL